MKKIGWTAILLGVVWFLGGCGKSEPQPPPPADVPEIPENVDAGKVREAVGNALLKGIAGGGQSDQPGQSGSDSP